MNVSMLVFHKFLRWGVALTVEGVPMTALASSKSNWTITTLKRMQEVPVPPAWVKYLPVDKGQGEWWCPAVAAAAAPGVEEAMVGGETVGSVFV